MTDNIFKLIYNTFLHNQLVIGLALAATVSLVTLIKKPARAKVFWFVGFLILILHFEYQKHIVKDLADQTAGVLFTEDGNYRAQWLTKIGFYHLIPLTLWLLGWGSILIGLLGAKLPRLPFRRRSPQT